MSEGVVGAGDYIEMEGGITGYVVDVNWHSTILRTWTNNLVAVPNSKISETVVTNYLQAGRPPGCGHFLRSVPTKAIFPG